jgi:hypothetical protein
VTPTRILSEAALVIEDGRILEILVVASATLSNNS